MSPGSRSQGEGAAGNDAGKKQARVTVLSICRRYLRRLEPRGGAGKQVAVSPSADETSGGSSVSPGGDGERHDAHEKVPMRICVTRRALV